MSIYKSIFDNYCVDKSWLVWHQWSSSIYSHRLGSFSEELWMYMVSLTFKLLEINQCSNDYEDEPNYLDKNEPGLKILEYCISYKGQNDSHNPEGRHLSSNHDRVWESSVVFCDSKGTLCVNENEYDRKNYWNEVLRRINHTFQKI